MLNIVELDSLGKFTGAFVYRRVCSEVQGDGRERWRKGEHCHLQPRSRRWPVFFTFKSAWFEGEGNTQKNNSIYTSKKSSMPNNMAHVCTKMFLLLLNPNCVVLYRKPWEEINSL